MISRPTGLTLSWPALRPLLSQILSNQQRQSNRRFKTAAVDGEEPPVRYHQTAPTKALPPISIHARHHAKLANHTIHSSTATTAAKTTTTIRDPPNSPTTRTLPQQIKTGHSNHTT